MHTGWIYWIYKLPNQQFNSVFLSLESVFHCGCKTNDVIPLEILFYNFEDIESRTQFASCLKAPDIVANVMTEDLFVELFLFSFRMRLSLFRRTHRPRNSSGNWPMPSQYLSTQAKKKGSQLKFFSELFEFLSLCPEAYSS